MVASTSTSIPQAPAVPLANLPAAVATLTVVYPQATCRIERAARLVRAGSVSRSFANVWLVTSESNPDHAYAIVPVGALLTCDCPDARQRGLPCKHTLSVMLYLACERIDAEANDPTTAPIGYELTAAALALLDNPMPAA